MRQKLKYLQPEMAWCIIDAEDLVCDSYGSGIDDYGYEDLDWTAKP